jgi:hypothetical protein
MSQSNNPKPASPEVPPKSGANEAKAKVLARWPNARLDEESGFVFVPIYTEGKTINLGYGWVDAKKHPSMVTFSGKEPAYATCPECHTAFAIPELNDCLAHRCMEHRHIAPLPLEDECAVCMMQHPSISKPRLEPAQTDSCPACRCLKSAHHGPRVGCEGAGGNCGCFLEYPAKVEPVQPSWEPSAAAGGEFELSDEQLVRLVYEFNLHDSRQLVYEDEKDGIDVEVPIHNYRALAKHIWLASRAALKPVAQKPEEDYVAWLRWCRNGNSSWLQLCNSDDDGAFKVYRHRDTREIP